MRLHFQTAARSDEGRRPANEDFYAIDENNGLYVVADGTASRGGGRTAAMIADFIDRRLPEGAGAANQPLPDRR